jgi:alkylation response protein AidB-like acyl-CoA dehydrogenase
MEADERALFASTLHEVLTGPAEAIDAQLAELGWDEVVAEDPATAHTLLFLEQGRSLAVTALLDQVVLGGLAADLPSGADAVLYPSFSSGARLSSDAGGVSGVLLRQPAPGARIAVPLISPHGPQLAVVPLADLELTPVRTFDASLPWFTATGAAPANVAPAPSWNSAASAALLALSAELIGISEVILRLAAEHTSTRIQFGHPIASFQAVRHRLAEAYVDIESARALLDAAYLDGTPLSASAAKAQAGRAHEQVTGHAVQVTGAMGSTEEHPLHTFVARGVVVDALLGGWAEHVRSLGNRVLETGEAPRLVVV